MRVVVYTKPACQPCRATKKRMEKLGVPFDELDIRDHLDYVRSLGYQEAPVVEVDCGDGATAHWSGFRPDHIDAVYGTLSDKLIAGNATLPDEH